MNFNDRLTQIENRRSRLQLHWIDPTYPGQPLDDAVKHYEAGQGPIGNGIVVHWDVFGEGIAA